MNTVVTTGFTTVMIEQCMQAMGTDYVVQNIGAEKVGSYNCTHYTITTTSSKYKNMPPQKKMYG
jgi:hypothetical protein